MSEAEERQKDSVQSDRQREEGGLAGSSVGQFSSLSLPLNLWIPLIPGHVIRPTQEVEERRASAQDPPWDRSSGRWRRRCESAVIFSLSYLSGSKLIRHRTC